MTAQSNSPLAHKGLITAAKVMALAAVRTMQRPDAIAEAKEFVRRQNGGKGYECPLPDSVAPPIGKY
jgi:aminobenzoyl-glutamate utilization protein B